MDDGPLDIVCPECDSSFEFDPPPALIQNAGSFIHFRCPNCEHRFDFALEKVIDPEISNVSIPEPPKSVETVEDKSPPDVKNAAPDEPEGHILIRTHDRQRHLAFNWEEVGGLISDGHLQPNDKVSAFGGRWKKAKTFPQLDSYFSMGVSSESAEVSVSPEPPKETEVEESPEMIVSPEPPVAKENTEPFDASASSEQVVSSEVTEIEQRNVETETEILSNTIENQDEQVELASIDVDESPEVATEIERDPSVPFEDSPKDTPEFDFPTIDFSGEREAGAVELNQVESSSWDDEPEGLGEPIVTDEVFSNMNWEQESEEPTHVEALASPPKEEKVSYERSPERDAYVAPEREPYVAPEREPYVAPEASKNDVYPSAILPHDEDIESDTLDVSLTSKAVAGPTTFIDDLDGPDFPEDDSDDFVDFEAYQNKMTNRVRLVGLVGVAVILTLIMYTFSGYGDGPNMVLEGGNPEFTADEVSADEQPPSASTEPAENVEIDPNATAVANAPDAELTPSNTDVIEQDASDASALEGDAVTGLSDTNSKSEIPRQPTEEDAEASPDETPPENAPSEGDEAENTPSDNSEALAMDTPAEADGNSENTDPETVSAGAEAVTDAEGTDAAPEDETVFDPSTVDQVRLTREGFLRIQQRRFDEAEAIFAYAIAQDPEDPYVLHGLGWAYEEQGNSQDAAKQYCRLVSLENAPEDLKRECQARVVQLEQNCGNEQL